LQIGVIMENEFVRYKELFLSEINTLKDDLKEFKKDIYEKFAKLKEDVADEFKKVEVTLAIISTKMLVGASFLTLAMSIAGSVLVYFITKG
jgi:hypothetical protein